MDKPTKTCLRCDDRPNCMRVCDAEIGRRVSLSRYYAVVRPSKTPVTVSGVCCICGNEFTRIKRTGDAKTCGGACAKAYKAKLKLEWNRRAYKGGYYREYHEKKKLPCPVCGGQMHAGSDACYMCSAMLTKRWPSSAFDYCRVCGRSKPAHRRCFNEACSVAMYKQRVKRKLHRKRNDPLWRMRVTISGQINAAIRRKTLWGKKTLATFEMLRYSPSDLVSYLQSRFEFGMTWSNYGSEWEVDHVVPVSWFRGQRVTSSTVRKVWALSNLRPRWKDNATAAKYGSFLEGNREKSARYAG